MAVNKILAFNALSDRVCFIDAISEPWRDTIADLISNKEQFIVRSENVDRNASAKPG